MKLVGASLLVLLALVGAARAQMPDLGAMSGTPLPAAELPDGTVSVRVVRGDLTNNVAGQAVELHGAPQAQTVQTDDSGRAVFTNVPAGATVHVMTRLDGKTIESQNFPMPPSGGVKLMLVGGVGAGQSAAPAMPSTAAPSTPATPGQVSLGGQSRFVVELTEEGLDVYLLMDIVNSSGGPVATGPLVFETPGGSQQLTVLDGSSPQAKADGTRFVVTGPFAPGITSVQMAYRLAYSSGSFDFEQLVPLELSMTQILVKKVGGMTFRSPQAASARETQMQGGGTFIMATGQGLPPGARIQFQLDGLPHHSRVPRFVALGIAVFVIGLGAWLASNGPDPRVRQARQKLERKRETLLDELAALEKQHAAKGIDQGRFTARRETLLTQLERVYAQLDHGAAPNVSEPARVQATQ